MTGGMTLPIVTSFSPQRLIVDALEPRRDAMQATDEVGQIDLEGSNWNDIANIAQFMEVDVENGMGRLVHPPAAGASSSGGLNHNRSESGEDALPTSSIKLVGQAFKENKNVVWSWLINDEVSSIGIYGMGGVGKTTILKHIHNQLLERPNASQHVYWVTVSQNFSIKGLQNLIAKCIDLDLSNEDDELHRAVKLSKELKKKHKWVLILDDLWSSFELHKVGVPTPTKGCKLILTTRSEKVCQRMDSQNKIKVKPLSEEEAWTLFMEKLGNSIALPPKVKEIAKSVTKECDGLPLGIITMAGTMKGVDDIHEWRNALEELKQSTIRKDDMEENVFKILRLSYMHLNDSTLQQCFLCCALFPEDFFIHREDLIGYLIDEGVIEGLKSREAEFDKGHSMLNILENVCLLERVTVSGDRYVRMHDLVRDMALQIQEENTQAMVKAGAQLKELPNAEEWSENLVRVSLMQNEIEEIPYSQSPTCPNLSTLLLNSNPILRFIADSFFKQLHRLKVLDLSDTCIEKLPDSVSDLVGLVALLLRGCYRLRYVPSLKKLRTVKRLDLSNTALENLPQDIECLSNLKYLRLHGCGQKGFPTGILPKFSHLQVFLLEEWMPIKRGWRQYAPVTVQGKEIACLSKLEALECHFEHFSDYAEYLNYRDENQALSTYKFFVGQLDENDYDRMTLNSHRSKVVGFGNFSMSRNTDFLVFLNDIEELIIYKCNDARSLCDVSSSIKYATELELIHIEDCNSMESLLSSSWFRADPLPWPSNGIFSYLKEFYCYGCTSMKKLFPLVLLPNLVNLEVIEVGWCDEVEEIIGKRVEDEVTSDESRSNNSITGFNLPKLRTLRLDYLPNLESICSAKLIFHSLKEIVVRECPKLKRMPVSLPLLENGSPSASPPSLEKIYLEQKDWWESVEWEHPNTKDVLLPFVTFL